LSACKAPDNVKQHDFKNLITFVNAVKSKDVDRLQKKQAAFLRQPVFLYQFQVINNPDFVVPLMLGLHLIPQVELAIQI
jgi:hypothetical protein